LGVDCFIVDFRRKPLRLVSTCLMKSVHSVNVSPHHRPRGFNAKAPDSDRKKTCGRI
jgi:hypothetical protein